MTNTNECISRSEAIEILGVKPNSFLYHLKRHNNVLKPARREGNAIYYRKCDVIDFRKIMEDSPAKTYKKQNKYKQPGEFNKVDNRLLSDALKFKKSIEDRMLVLQNTHKQLCITIKDLSK